MEKDAPPNYLFNLGQLLCKSILSQKCSFEQLMTDCNFDSLVLDKIVIELLLEHVVIINDPSIINAILEFICNGLFSSFILKNCHDQ